MMTAIRFPAETAHGDEGKNGEDNCSEKEEAGRTGVEKGGGRASAAAERPRIVGEHCQSGGTAEEEKRRNTAE